MPVPPSATLSFAAPGGTHESARFTQVDAAAGLRTYEQSSTMPTRGGVASTIRYAETAGMPVVRSGSLAFDALFAHAVVEMKANSVAAIRDGAYNDGKPIPCECFETGEQWHYVWTRDLSYAAHLGLAMLDPDRVRNSLEFKLSGYRPGIVPGAGVAGSGDGLQVIQDTGSGGSWPVSTDRVSWAFGAEAALDALAPAERAVFAATALKALVNTLENDRLAAFDPHDGLYTGEQSFLDWREQSYGDGIANELARMASAKALSTNVAHFKALSLAARLSEEQGAAAQGAKYRGWAGELKTAINRRFWLDGAGMYSSLTAAHFDGQALHKFDWLGQSLAIVTGVADAARGARILASYPHGPVGAPVIFPQQPGVPIYHNRAIWPFVTAYGLNAAAAIRNVSVADAAYASLVRGAALHLSNMENMEWLSGAPLLEDPRHPALNGPVINSRRQLWSVGAYLGMVVRNVFGVALAKDGLEIQPFITARLRREMFGASNLLVLDGLRLRGGTVRIEIALPPATPGEGYFVVDAIRLNGKAAASAIRWDQLEVQNVIEVRLAALAEGQRGIRRVDGDPRATDGALFAPFDPSVARVERNGRGGIELHMRDERNPPGSVLYSVYRNGKLVADRLAAGPWTDAAPARLANCYAVAAQAVGSGNRSHHSAVACIDSGIDIAVDDPRVETGAAIVREGGPFIRAWGAPDERFGVRAIGLTSAGRYSFQVRYRNTNHAINTGISNGVKVLAVRDAAGRVVARRVVQMPHLPPDSAPLYSTPAEMTLAAGSYSVELTDFYNMSYLNSNAVYGAGGGKGGALNRVDLYGIRILVRE